MDLKTYFKEIKNEWKRMDYNLFVLKLSIHILCMAIPFIFLNLFLPIEINNFWSRMGVSGLVIVIIITCWNGIKKALPPETSSLLSFSFINKIDNYNDLKKICFFLWFIILCLILCNQGLRYKNEISKFTTK